MHLLIEITPFRDESFISWFCRTAFANGTDAKSLALSIWRKDSIFYKDLDRFIPNNLIYELLKVSSLTFKELKNLTLESIIDKVNTSKSDNPYKKWSLINPFAQKGKIRTNGICFCPECLKATFPYINKYWRFSWFIACPIHKNLLILSCEKCNCVFSPEKLDYLSQHIYLCAKCGYDLRNSKIKKVSNEVLKLQNLLSKAIVKGKVSSSLPLVTKNNTKDLFLTLHIFLAFILKVLRQPIRFKDLIQKLNIQTKYKFEKRKNGTFSRLNITDKEQLLFCIEKIFKLNINSLIKILIQQKITKNILKQTFINISPSIEYILNKLSDKKLNRFYSKKIKRNILPKNPDEVDKLFKDILPFISTIEENNG